VRGGHSVAIERCFTGWFQHVACLVIIIGSRHGTCCGPSQNEQCKEARLGQASAHGPRQRGSCWPEESRRTSSEGECLAPALLVVARQRNRRDFLFRIIDFVT